MTSTLPPAPRRRFVRRVLPVLAKALLGLAAALLLAEFGLRFLLFSDHPGVVARTKALRKSGNFAGRSYDEEFWKLIYAFKGDNRVRSTPRDPVLGWVRHDVLPVTYEHRAAAEIGERKPVLVFGDSFANCVTGEADCWEGLMEGSGLGQRYKVVNYGTGGYGFDQIVLSVREILPLYVDRDPVVVVSLLIDSDLERSTLRCRDWPKPHFSLDESGQLLPDGPVAASESEFLAEHPLRIRSYLWRFLLHGTDILPASWVRELTNVEKQIDAARQINRGLLELVVTELEACGVEYFFLLFHSRGAYDRDASARWEEAFFVEQLELLDVPYFLSRIFLREAAIDGGVPESSFYIEKGAKRNHLTAEGNAVVFEAFERGLARNFDDLAAVRWLGWDFIKCAGEGTSVRWESSGAPGESAAFVFTLGAAGTVRTSYTLAGRATSLRARFRGDGPAGSSAILRIQVDDATAHEETAGPDGTEMPLDIDLRGARSLVITAIAEGPITLRCVEPRIEGLLPGGAEPSSIE